MLEAIDSGDDQAIVEELGDVLLQVLLDSQIAADEGRFTLVDVVDVLTQKMIRRHPHVFGDTAVNSASDVTRNWDHIKQNEKQRESMGVRRHSPRWLAPPGCPKKRLASVTTFPRGRCSLTNCVKN